MAAAKTARRASVLNEVNLDLTKMEDIRDSFQMHRTGDAVREGRLGDFGDADICSGGSSRYPSTLYSAL
jgi:hypothetical protein